MLKDFVWHGLTIESENRVAGEKDENCPFNQFRRKQETLKGETFKNEPLIGAVVQIDGAALEKSGEDFLDALYKEARIIDGKSRAKTIKAKALRALAKQTQKYLDRMGYKLIAIEDGWPE